MIAKRFSAIMMVAVIAAAGAACDDDEDAEGPQAEVYVASLTGGAEVPQNASTATGTARVEFTATGLTYTINVTNLRNLSLAHIHGPAPVGVNAGVVLNFNPTAALGVFTGVLAAGTATATNSTTIGMDSLKALIRNGQAYVNVHTNDNVNPTGTGPGDLSAGEIRGQLTRQN